MFNFLDNLKTLLHLLKLILKFFFNLNMCFQFWKA